MEYEKLYQTYYSKIDKLIKGDPCQIEDELLKKFNQRLESMIDEKYEKLEVPVCEVKDI